MEYVVSGFSRTPRTTDATSYLLLQVEQRDVFRGLRRGNALHVREEVGHLRVRDDFGTVRRHPAGALSEDIPKCVEVRCVRRHQPGTGAALAVRSMARVAVVLR